MLLAPPFRHFCHWISIFPYSSSWSCVILRHSFVMLPFCHWSTLRSCDLFSVYICSPLVHELLFFTFVISGFPAPSLSFVTGWTSGLETPSLLFSSLLSLFFSPYQYISFLSIHPQHETTEGNSFGATPLGANPLLSILMYPLQSQY